MTALHLRPDLEEIPSYRQGKPPVARSGPSYKLSSNESPFGPLPSVVERVRDAVARANLYPNMAAPELVAALARRHEVAPARIALGAGSVEVISQMMRAVASPGDEVLFAWRSFEAYPMLAVAAGARPVTVPLDASFRHNLPALAAAVTDRTRAVLVCNPNNPTGTTVTHQAFTEFMQAVPANVLVVLDAAYTEFDSAADAPRETELLAQYPNLAVARTFSKAYGLAGMRVGYAVAPIAVAEAMSKVAVPFGVTAMAQAAALASLEAASELAERVHIVMTERDRVAGALRAAGWTVPQTAANFVWVASGERTPQVVSALEEAGVSARTFDGEGVRITTGTPAANDVVIAALTTLGA